MSPRRHPVLLVSAAQHVLLYFSEDHNMLLINIIFTVDVNELFLTVSHRSRLFFHAIFVLIRWFLSSLVSVAVRYTSYIIVHPRSCVWLLARFVFAIFHRYSGRLSSVVSCTATTSYIIIAYLSHTVFLCLSYAAYV